MANTILSDVDKRKNDEKAKTDVASTPDVPKWSWGFMGACLLLLVIGGGLGGFCGAAGAMGCRAIAAREDMSTATRMAICLGITLATWVVYFVVAVFILRLL
jgi:hypothetical protein